MSYDKINFSMSIYDKETDKAYENTNPRLNEILQKAGYLQNIKRGIIRDIVNELTEALFYHKERELEDKLPSLLNPSIVKEHRETFLDYTYYTYNSHNKEVILETRKNGNTHLRILPIRHVEEPAKSVVLLVDDFRKAFRHFLSLVDDINQECVDYLNTENLPSCLDYLLEDWNGVTFKAALPFSRERKDLNSVYVYYMLSLGSKITPEPKEKYQALSQDFITSCFDKYHQLKLLGVI